MNKFKEIKKIFVQVCDHSTVPEIGLCVTTILE